MYYKLAYGTNGKEDYSDDEYMARSLLDENEDIVGVTILEVE